MINRMNIAKIYAVVVTTVCLVATAALAQTQNWTPKPALVSKLDKPKTYDGFSLRVPAGMVVQKLTQSASGGTMTVYTWNHKSFKGVLKGIALTLFDQALPKSPEDLASDWIDQTVSRNISDVTHSDVESGTIDGFGFARIYYKGPMRKSGKIAHGFVYVGVTEGRTYIFESVDFEPDNKESLPVNEAAVLTLHETQ